MSKHNNFGFQLVGLIVTEAIATSFIFTAVTNYKNLGYWAVITTLSVVAFYSLKLMYLAIRQIPTLLGYGDAVTYTVKSQSTTATKAAKNAAKNIKTAKKSPALRYS